MITDKQFIDALHQVVEDTPNTVAPAAYWVKDRGAFCIIGRALFGIAPKLCPRDNRKSAETLLLGLGCSMQVANAAEIAQTLNDQGVPFRLIGPGFDEALSRLRMGESAVLVRRDTLIRVMAAYRAEKILAGPNFAATGKSMSMFVPGWSCTCPLCVPSPIKKDLALTA